MIYTVDLEIQIERNSFKLDNADEFGLFMRQHNLHGYVVSFFDIFNRRSLEGMIEIASHTDDFYILCPNSMIASAVRHMFDYQHEGCFVKKNGEYALIKSFRQEQIPTIKDTLMRTFAWV